ncbi:hypothetical protein ScPMuIL_001094 [Solemya velum]
MLFLLVLVVQVVLAASQLPFPCSQYHPKAVRHGSSCYVASIHFPKSIRYKTYHDAVEFCRDNYGAYSVLVRIEDEDENNFLYEYLSGNLKNWYWIGVYITWSPLKMEYADCGEIVYDNFAPGEPNNHRQNERCVEKRKYDYTWDDDVCSKKKKYICEIPTVVEIYCCDNTCTPDPFMYPDLWGLTARDVCLIRADIGKNCVKNWDFYIFFNGMEDQATHISFLS